MITMRRYPRFVARELRDEYLQTMSPVAKLHEDWLAVKRRTHDHNGAFAKIRYERRFEPSAEGWADLERLSGLARKKNVFLVCQCRVGDRCHREMLLILARELFRAPTEAPRNDYPEFRRRMPEFERAARASPEAGPRLSSKKRTSRSDHLGS